jgi:hypothetical protein
LNRTHRYHFRLFALAAVTICTLTDALAAPAQTLPETSLWQSVEQSLKGRPQSETWIRPDVFRSFQLQHTGLRAQLGRAPKGSSQAVASSGAVISLPMPDGTQARFRFVEAPVMHPDLAARFPEIKTYRGQGIDDPAATVRFDLTPVGFHAQILSPSGAVYVEPYLRGNTNLHAVYARRDYQASSPDFQCQTSSSVAAAPMAASAASQVISSGNLRTYRLAPPLSPIATETPRPC